MPTSLIERIRRAALPPTSGGDGELLGRFVEQRDGAALAALVTRHGPMVWGVCRRLLGHHDAEDAFQATFIVLVRKAATVSPREMVGNWLYGVAHRTALQAGRSAVRRSAREVTVKDMPDAEAPSQDDRHDVRPLLDEELSRLPDHFRVVIVLCDLEGETRKVVAERLGCPEGTVASRLARARSMLAKRLARRGVALSGAALSAALSQGVASAGVPTSLVFSTIKAANLFAAGQAAVTAKIAALAEGVLNTMLFTKLKGVMAVFVVAAAVGLAGYGMATGRPSDGEPAGKSGEPKGGKVEDAVAKGKAEKVDTVAWGKEVDGLQAGLVADAVVRRPGDKIELVVKLRNVGKADVTITYGRLQEYRPEITTADGVRMWVYMPPVPLVIVIPSVQTVKAGETVTLYNPRLAVESEDRAKMRGEMLVDTPTICVAAGRYTIAYGGMISSHPKLATAAVTFEVKPPARAAAPVDDGVAWGKAVGGLQAGLGSATRTYRHGETATLSLRVRNVGKAAVEFKHIWAFFVENPPAVTDADGKRVALPKGAAEGRHLPRNVEIAPGKEVEVYEWKMGLQPKGEKGKAMFTVHGTGRFDIRCERVVGPTSSNLNHPDPALDKLATGKVEIEIKPAQP